LDLGRHFVCLCGEIAKNRRQGGGDIQMKIFMIDALVPAASTTKSN